MPYLLRVLFRSEAISKQVYFRGAYNHKTICKYEKKAGIKSVRLFTNFIPAWKM